MDQEFWILSHSQSRAALFLLCISADVLKTVCGGGRGRRRILWWRNTHHLLWAYLYYAQVTVSSQAFKDSAGAVGGSPCLRTGPVKQKVLEMLRIKQLLWVPVPSENPGRCVQYKCHLMASNGSSRVCLMRDAKFSQPQESFPQLLPQPALERMLLNVNLTSSCYNGGLFVLVDSGRWKLTLLLKVLHVIKASF